MIKNIICNVVGVVLFALASFIVIDFGETTKIFLACLPLYIIGTILVAKTIPYFLQENK